MQVMTWPCSNPSSTTWQVTSETRTTNNNNRRVTTKRPEESPASGSSTSSRQVKRKENPPWQSYSLQDSIACRFVQFHADSCLWKYSQPQCKYILIFCQTYEFAKKIFMMCQITQRYKKALIRYHPLLRFLLKGSMSVNEWNRLSNFRKKIF